MLPAGAELNVSGTQDAFKGVFGSLAKHAQPGNRILAHLRHSSYEQGYLFGLFV